MPQSVKRVDDPSLPHRGVVTVGDWSEDGHNHWVSFEYSASHSISEQQKGYAVTQEQTGLGFNCNEHLGSANLICSRYRHNRVAAYHVELLRRFAGIDHHRVGDIGPRGGVLSEREFASFFVWFCGAFIPEFEFSEMKTLARAEAKEIAGDPRVLNGWWGPLNIGVGYGLYMSSFREEVRFADIAERKFVNISENNVQRINPAFLPEHIVRCNDIIPHYYEEEIQKFADWVEGACEGRVWYSGKMIFFDDPKDASKFMLCGNSPKLIIA